MLHILFMGVIFFTPIIVASILVSTHDNPTNKTEGLLYAGAAATMIGLFLIGSSMWHNRGLFTLAGFVLLAIGVVMMYFGVNS